jgi:hypothetical protein
MIYIVTILTHGFKVCNNALVSSWENFLSISSIVWVENMCMMFRSLVLWRSLSLKRAWASYTTSHPHCRLTEVFLIVILDVRSEHCPSDFNSWYTKTRESRLSPCNRVSRMSGLSYHKISSHQWVWAVIRENGGTIQDWFRQKYELQIKYRFLTFKMDFFFTNQPIWINVFVPILTYVPHKFHSNPYSRSLLQFFFNFYFCTTLYTMCNKHFTVQ